MKTKEMRYEKQQKRYIEVKNVVKAKKYKRIKKIHSIK